MNRNATLDYARLVASFGIVIFHVGAPGAALGYAALPFFLILLVVMVLPSAKCMSFDIFLKSRVKRLIVPWLIWSAIYGTLKLSEVVVTETTLSAEFAPYMLFTGPALHLWFLPFAFITSLLAYPVIQSTRFAPIYLHSTLLTMIALFFLVIQQERAFPIPITQWLYGAPAISLGLGLALVGRQVWASILMVCVFSSAALLIDSRAGLLQILIAAVAFILCSTWRLPQTSFSALASKSALGVYLSHPLVISILTRTTSLDPQSSTTAILVCIGSLGIALLRIWVVESRSPILNRTHGDITS